MEQKNDNCTRCLYCSLLCPVSAEKQRNGTVRPGYPEGQSGRTGMGLCYRGHYLAALMAHPKRITKGQGARFDGEHDAVVVEAAEVISRAVAAKTLGVMVSANMPVEELAATVGAALQAGVSTEQITIFMPPTDKAIFDGTRRGKCRKANFKDLRNAKTTLAIGDVLGTHPVLAAELIGAKEQNRRANLILLDSIAGRCARFATSQLSIAHRSEAAAILAIAQAAGAKLEQLCQNTPKAEELLQACRLDERQVQDCAQSLKDDASAVIVLTIPPGRTHQSELLAAAAGLLAETTGAALIPLYHYGGSVGACAMAESLGLANNAQWVQAAQNGRFSTALVVAADPVGMLPDDIAGTIIEKIDCLIAASAMPNATTQLANITLPLAFWFEIAGSVLDHTGESVRLESLAQPPGAAQTPSGLIDQLAQTEAAEIDIDFEKIAKELSNTKNDKKYEINIENIENIEQGRLVITSRTESLDLYEASLSQQLDWPLTIEPQPVVVLNPNDAAKQKLRDKDLAQLTNNGYSTTLAVRISSAVPEGSAAVGATAPQTKGLFDWKIDENTIATATGKATIGPGRTENT